MRWTFAPPPGFRVSRPQGATPQGARGPAGLNTKLMGLDDSSLRADGGGETGEWLERARPSSFSPPPTLRVRPAPSGTKTARPARIANADEASRR